MWPFRAIAGFRASVALSKAWAPWEFLSLSPSRGQTRSWGKAALLYMCVGGRGWE